MTDERFEQFKAEQLRVLAGIVLTRRNDLKLGTPRMGSGIDLLVNVEQEDNSMALAFGVVLRGTITASSLVEVDALLTPMQEQFQESRKLPYPACIFLFNLSELQGYVSWLAEPVLIDGAPKLVHHTKARCQQLTTEVLNDLVDRVVTWYDAVEAVLTA
jgi:hypothetical protein